MTNRRRRVRISLLLFKIHSAGGRFWWLVAHLLRLPVSAITLVQWPTRRRIEKFASAAAKIIERTNSILSDLHTLDRRTERGKQQLLAADSLLEESARLKLVASELLSHYARSGDLLIIPTTYTMKYLQTKFATRKRKTNSFLKVIARIDGEIFYGELLLWFVIPVAYGEELLGDLNEEYLLRRSNEGEGCARRWYRDQVVRTLKDSLWQKLERIAIVGALVDLVDRWWPRH
jgi:hypothetical protein